MNNITTRISLYHQKRGFSIFQTTDIEAINQIINDGQDKLFQVGGQIDLYDSQLDKNIKWKILQIQVGFFDKEIMLPVEGSNTQGYKNPYNNEIIVYVEESSE